MQKSDWAEQNAKTGLGPTVGAVDNVPIEELASEPPAFKPLTNTQMLFVGSAMVANWTAGIIQICGVGFILPVIQRDLQSTAQEVQWVNNAFNIAWGSFALVSGRVSDIYGLRRSFLCGITWCGLWLAISAFMPRLIDQNVAALSATRALAGVGHAMACPAASGIIGTYFPEGRPRSIAYSAVAGVGAIGAGIGWTLGGVLGNVKYSWRLVNAINVGLMLYPLIVGFITIPRDRPHPTDKKVDWLGALGITGTQVCLTLALTSSITDSQGWRAKYIPVLIAISVVLLVVFVWQQMRLNRAVSGPPPLVPSRLFDAGTRTWLSLYLMALFVWVGVDNLAVNGSFYYAEVLHLEPIQAGLRTLPSVAAGLSAAIVVALAIGHVPARIILVACNFLNSLCGVLFATRNVDTPFWKSDLWAWIVNGYATDGSAAVASIIISSMTKEGDQAAAAAIFLSIARFGAGIGLALTTLLRTEVAKRSSTEVGLKAAFWMGAASLIMSGLVVAVGLRGWAIVGRKTQN